MGSITGTFFLTNLPVQSARVKFYLQKKAKARQKPKATDMGQMLNGKEGQVTPETWSPTTVAALE